MTLKRMAWYGAAIAIVAGGLIFAFWPQAVPVDVAVIKRGNLTVTIDGDGRTRVREIYVVSAPVPGRVLRIQRHVGDVVVADETILATIQPSDPGFLDRRARAQAEANAKAAAAAFALAEAELARAMAELEFAQSELDRAEPLAARGTVPQRELDRARLAVRTAKAAVATAEATVEIRRFELETARAGLIEPGGPGSASDRGLCCVDVYSPVDGRVLHVVHESETVVAAGAALVEVGDPRDLEIVVDLLSSDAVRIAEGAAVAIEEWGGGDALSGRVRHVEPTGFTKVSALGIEEQRVNVIIDFTDPSERWRNLGHGYRVEVRIVIWRGEDVLVLPLGAMFRDAGRWAVFVADGGRAHLRHIEVGHASHRFAEIIGGLSQGDRVVLHPSDLISDGVRVVPRSEE
ncbi:MAG: HlyD family efflux transporter periplasmic adaptor subunit [Rhodospirillales bacterium]|nr:MAG: HlyD family efflux transporter periplasmic adaptor subunit [Rhodospirillales bacterium]